MTTLMSYQGSFLPPGQLPSVESIEQDLTSVIWNRLELQLIGSNALISGAARDNGNTDYESVLRPGLLLTKDANGKLLEWGGVVNFATDTIEGVMLMAQRITRGGANQDRWLGYILLGGLVKAQGLIVPENAGSGIVGDTNETLIRQQMRIGFRFDDDPLGHLGA